MSCTGTTATAPSPTSARRPAPTSRSTAWASTSRRLLRGGVDFYVTDLPIDHLFKVWDPAASAYLDATATFGMQGGGVGWAYNWLDYDNDGWQDLYVVQNAWPNLLYRNPAQPVTAQVRGRTSPRASA